jgi:glycerol-3-phosphate cytidylyltransferase
MRYYIAGVWDLFHIGHLRALMKAREIASWNHLIVGVVTDEDAERYKGQRPIINERERFLIIEALACTDRVVFQDVQFSINHMAELGIDKIIIGEDWNGKMPEELTKRYEIIYIPRTEGVSTTLIKERICGNTQR